MTLPSHQTPPHPAAFIGPYAITPENLWLMVWEKTDGLGVGTTFRQWICLADQGQAGHDTLDGATTGVGRLLFALSLSQLRQAIGVMGGAQLSSSPNASLPEWMPLISKNFVIILQKADQFFTMMIRASSAQSAIKKSQEQYPDAIVLSCGSKQDIEQASSSLEHIIRTRDTTPIKADFRNIPEKDTMWLEMMRDPHFRSVAG